MSEEKVNLLMRNELNSTEEKVKLILEEAKRIKEQAEAGAVKIIEEARKKASEIIEKNGLVKGDISTGVNIKARQKYISKSIKNNWKRPKLGISSPDIFHLFLERERTRSDRNGHKLSLVLFEMREDVKGKVINLLIKALKSRARSIDRFGWYNAKNIGVILPNTFYEGGVRFAHNICEMIFSNKVPPPCFKVYSYPQKWLQETNDFNKVKQFGIIPENKTNLEGVNNIFVKETPFWKRVLDILGSLTALIIFSPLFIFIPLIIKIVSPGPVFFRQDRVGQGGRNFSFLKLRTMKINNDSTSHKKYLNDLIKSDKPMKKLDKDKDPRIIPFGRFIRKACIDELPQLINVLRGEMSLVGPRPCLPYEVKEYQKWHKYRFDIKPGMTGLWQVSGKNNLTFKEMIRLDIMYAKKMSLWLDLRILIQTFPTVFSSIFDYVVINSLYHRLNNKTLSNLQFKEFIKRYYSDIYNVDKLEFLNEKLKGDQIDLMELMMLLLKLNNVSPNYKAAKRYYGIVKLIDFEKRSQLRNIKQQISHINM